MTMWYPPAESFDPVDPPHVKVIRVCCISDTHVEAHTIPGGIPECNLLIHAGDFTNKGERQKILEFDDWGGSIPLPTENKICIAGNHDLTFHHSPDVARAHLTQWTYLEDSFVTVLGLKIYGTPWSAAFYPANWAFNQKRGEESVSRWAQIPKDTDIFISHGPPFGYGDRTRGKHVGCVDLSTRLLEIKPRLTVCGHIHTDQGIFAAPWGTLVNACVIDEEQKRIPIVIDLPIVGDR